LAVLSVSAPLAALSKSGWKESKNDPIYNPYPSPIVLYDDYFPAVLYNKDKFHQGDNGFYYKMWQQGDNGSGGATGQLAFSGSNDGIHWVLKGLINIENLTSSVGHPCVIYDEHGFGGTPYTYQMWFWNGNVAQGTLNNIYQTFSTDGMNWTTPTLITQDPNFPLTDGITGSYFQQLYGPGFVIYNPNASNDFLMPYTYRYVMFFDASGAGLVPGNNAQEEIGLAYSSDGLHWIRYGNVPVLIPSGNASDWDGLFMFRPSIILVNGTYHMYYSGSNGDQTLGTNFAHGLGHATSQDGINWVKDPTNPTFINTDGVYWRTDRTYTPCVLYGTFKDSKGTQHNMGKMWFVGSNQPYPDGTAISYATFKHH